MTQLGDETFTPIPIEDGAVAVALQDQHTRGFDIPLSRTLSAFTLSADTVASGSHSNLVYIINATAGHGLSAGMDIRLCDHDHDRQFFAKVISVNVDAITLDRPMDYAYHTAHTECHVVGLNMNVDGSSTPVIFDVHAGVTQVDILYYTISMVHTDAADDSKFGGITALTRGCVFRVCDGYQSVMAAVKDNARLKMLTSEVVYSDKAGGGKNGTFAVLRVSGQENRGIVHRISGTGSSQLIVQDNLTGLTSFYMCAHGHLTVGEEL